MAMTKNMRATVNIISKLFNAVDEIKRPLYNVQTANTVNDAIVASNKLKKYSARVDKLCDKLGFEREIVDEIYIKSEGCEDVFVLHLLSINEYAFSAYSACVHAENMDDNETAVYAEPSLLI